MAWLLMPYMKSNWREDMDKERSINKPEGIEEEHLNYLDKLQRSGSTNMFGADRFLLARFPALAEETALSYVVYWMETYGVRQEQKEQKNARP